MIEAPRNISNAGRTPLSRWLALMLAVVITLIGGALYGNYSQRWGPPADLVSAGAHLSEFPRQIGRWNLAEESPLGKTAEEMLECAGYVNRRYIHQDSGQTINVAILVGPPGPIAVHTPEICFSSRAYDRQGERAKVAITTPAKPESTFWRVDFSTRNPLAESLRVYYAWSRGGPWSASERPRFEYGAAPMLFKIQLAAPLAPGSDDSQLDPGRIFLEDLCKSDWRLVIPNP